MLSFSHICLLLALLHVSFSLPFNIAYDKPPGNDPKLLQNKNVKDLTVAEANSQVVNARRCFEMFRQGNPEAIKIYEAAFGKPGINSDKDKVDTNIRTLEKGTLHAQLATSQDIGDATARVEYKPTPPGFPSATVECKNSKGEKYIGTASWAKFGPAFDTPRMKFIEKAWVMIHEYTHQQSGTRDGVEKLPDGRYQIVGSNTGSKLRGYVDIEHPLPYTLADIAQHTKFTAIKDGAINMEENAESYALFARLSSYPNLPWVGGDKNAKASSSGSGGSGSGKGKSKP